MRGVRFLILLVVGYPARLRYAYRDAKKGPVDDTPKHDKVFSVDVRQDRRARSEVRIGRSDDACRRRARTGRSCSPSPAPSDQAAVSGITSNLASIGDSAGHRRESPDLNEFGLDTPRVEVAFKAAGPATATADRPEDARRHGHVREAAPTEARVSAFPPFSTRHSTAPRSTCSDKSVLKLDREKVDASKSQRKITRRGSRKSNGEWKILKPAAGRAEFSAVDGLVSRVARSR